MRPWWSHVGPGATAVLFLLVGCGVQRSGTVQGRVSYDGKSLTRGVIVFVPTDGTGSACGGLVRDGEYRVSGIQPGVKLVTIKAAPVVPEATTSEAMYERSAVKPVEDMSQLPIPHAAGNNAEATVVAGDQAMDFLLRPAGR